MAEKICHFEKNVVQCYANQNLPMEMLNPSALQNKFFDTQHIHLHESQAEYKQIPEISNISQGSVLSLNSRFMGEQSDVLPLTENHMCSYEECRKFHNINNNNLEGPGSPVKHAIFYMVLIMLLLWVIMYAVLSQMNYL